jgi:hypothetical protein
MKNIVASEVHLHAFLGPHKGFFLPTAFSNRGFSNSNAFEYNNPDWHNKCVGSESRGILSPLEVLQRV